MILTMAIAPFTIGPACKVVRDEYKWNESAGKWSSRKLKKQRITTCPKQQLSPEQKKFLQEFARLLTENLKLNNKSDPLRFTPLESYTYFNTLKNWLKRDGYDKFLEIAHVRNIKTYFRARALEERAQHALRHAQKKIIKTQPFIEIVIDWFYWATEQMDTYKEKGILLHERSYQKTN